MISMRCKIVRQKSTNGTTARSDLHLAAARRGRDLREKEDAKLSKKEYMKKTWKTINILRFLMRSQSRFRKSGHGGSCIRARTYPERRGSPQPMIMYLPVGLVSEAGKMILAGIWLWQGHKHREIVKVPGLEEVCSRKLKMPDPNASIVREAKMMGN